MLPYSACNVKVSATWTLNRELHIIFPFIPWTHLYEFLQSVNFSTTLCCYSWLRSLWLLAHCNILHSLPIRIGRKERPLLSSVRSSLFCVSWIVPARYARTHSIFFVSQVALSDFVVTITIIVTCYSLVCCFYFIIIIMPGLFFDIAFTLSVIFLSHLPSVPTTVAVLPCSAIM